jgi:hypothetical protein
MPWIWELDARWVRGPVDDRSCDDDSTIRGGHTGNHVVREYEVIDRMYLNVYVPHRVGWSAGPELRDGAASAEGTAFRATGALPSRCGPKR